MSRSRTDLPTTFMLVGGRVLVAVVAFFSFTCAANDPLVSRNIAGVTARFTVLTPKIHLGQRLRVKAVYRNESNQAVVFRFLPPIYDAKILHGGVEKLPCLSPEVPYTEIELKPGQAQELEDEMPFSAECNEAGEYEIRFYYNLNLLADKELAAEYARKFPTVDGAIAWQDRGHRFTLLK